MENSAMDNKLKGTGVALVTPFNTNKEVDYTALDRIVESVTRNGADFLVVLGTTAETPTLTAAEKRGVAARVVAANAGRLPVVLGLGGNDTKEVEDALRALDTKGIDAILSVTPYYNKPSQSGLYEHYKAVAAASKLPVVLYNVPGRTGVNLSADTCLRLAEVANIVAVKEASGNLTQIAQILRDRPSGFKVFSGDDSLTLPQLAMGVDGVISVAANAFPKVFCRMVKLALRGEVAKAAGLHLNMLEAFDLLFAEGNPTGVKAAMAIKGLLENELRLPLMPASTELYGNLQRVLATLE